MRKDVPKSLVKQRGFVYVGPESGHVSQIDVPVEVKKSVFSGFGAVKDKWKNFSHLDKHYIWQTAGALGLALDGLIAGDMGTVKTGLMNAGKNVGFFPAEKGLKQHYDEPESTLRADFWSAAVSTATNTPMFASNYQTLVDVSNGALAVTDALASGDMVRAVVGTLAVTAYGLQTCKNLKKLYDHTKSVKAEQGEFPSKSVRVESSKLSGFVRSISSKIKSGMSSTFDFVTDRSSDLMALRSCTMIAVGAFTFDTSQIASNVSQIASGFGFLKGAQERGLANREEPSLHHRSVDCEDDETEEETMGASSHGVLPSPT